MNQYHLSSPHRVQAVRLFHLIQQFSQNPRPVLNADSLLSFLQRLGLKNDEVIKFLHNIDKDGKQMNQQYWGLCISRYFSKVQLKCVNDLSQFHANFRIKICQQVFQPLYRYEQWDDNRMKTAQAKDASYSEIIDNWGTIKLFLHNMDTMSVNNNIYNINKCFSMCTLFPEKIDEIVSIYQAILKGNFLSTLEYMLTMNIDDGILIQILKTLCYLYQATKYQSINRLLKQSFLLTPQTMKGLMRSMQDNRVQLRYYTCVMATILVHQVPLFRQQILRDNQFLLSCCTAIGVMKQSQGLYYGLSFLIVLIDQFSVMEQSFQNENSQIISNIFKFAMLSLQNCKQTECQAACLNLLAECLKISTITDDQMKTLKVVTNVFDFKQEQYLQPLIAGALEIIKVSLCYERIQAQQNLMGDKNFEHYLKKVLQIEHKSWQPMLSLLQICQMIARTHHSKMLFQKQIIDVLFKMTIPQQGNTTNNGCIMFYLSEIILHLVQTSLESQWKLTYLHEKKLVNTIGNLLTASFTNDQVLLGSYGGLFYSETNVDNMQNIFCHKQVFTNCMKVLLLISSETPGCSYNKKKQLYVKEFNSQFVIQFWKAVRHYLLSSKNQTYTMLNLKQEYKIATISKQLGQNVRNVKMCRMISTVIEEMTYCLRKRNTMSDPSILREVHQMRHYIYEIFYRMMSYQELESDSIPIYFTMVVNIQGSNKEVKSKLHRLNWSQFQAYLTQAIRSALAIEPGAYNIKETAVDRMINTEMDYHKLIEWVFNNYQNSNFMLKIALFNIQKRVQNQFVQDRPIPAFGIRNQYPGSYRESPNRNFQVPRFMSTRLPESRGASPFGSYRGTEPRRPSPTFSSPCRNCSVQTSNRSGLCNNCGRY